VDLAPGVYTVGRSSQAEVQIVHPSVSGAHCQISVRQGAMTVTDLGSTNGIFLDNQPVQECQIDPGQVLRLGEVEIRLGPPDPLCRPRSFYKSIPGAFVYPLKRNGLFLLAVGTLVFGTIFFFATFRFNGRFMAGLVGLILAAYVIGYLFLYMQAIITSTALGGKEMPPWPEYENWWDSGAQPYFRLLAIFSACVAPAILCAAYFGSAGRLLLAPWLVAAFCYGPMALLAVAMDDSLAALNPLLVIPAIGRVPLEYLVSCLLFGGLLFGLSELTARIGLLHPPIVRQMLNVFIGLYFMVVEMRLLGLLYYTRKDRFGWRA
jgi:pSer/pThr/pTyr-binding forkhead associated (FHA) protein